MGNKMIFSCAIFILLIIGTVSYHLQPHPFDAHIEWLTANSEFEYHGEDYPEVIYKTEEQIQVIAYTQDKVDEANNNGTDIPRIKALYNHQDNVIILQKGTDIKSHDTAYIIVHELVHYLQMINGITKQESCIPALEFDAYLLQYKWQKAHDHPGPYPNWLFVKMLTSSCRS